MTRTAVFADLVRVGPPGQTIEPGAVLIDGASIEAVGTAADIEPHCDARTTRLAFPPGATVVPGLIDCHVHLSFDTTSEPFAAVARADDTAVLDMMARHAHQLVVSGVTTARDLGDRDGLVAALRRRITDGRCTGPTLLTAGTPLTCPGGHCALLGGEVRTPDEIASLISRNHAAGVDLVKVMASGGALTPGGPPMWAAQFTREQLRHIVATAAAHQLPVAAHAHGTDTIADCVAAGVRTIEHCSWRDGRQLRYDHDLARDIAARDIAVCRCVSGDWRQFLRRLGPNAEPLIESILGMRDAGVRFIAGTDAGVPGATFRDYAGMLEFFTAIGFSTTDVLAMATSDAAHALGLRDVGSIRPGYRADLVVVGADPLADISALRDIRLVMTSGTIVHVASD